MIISKIMAHNFRNFKNVILEFDPRLNLIVGKNGQGKTNLLEAIHFLATAESHRTNKNKEMINWDSQKCSVQLILKKQESRLKLGFSLEERNKIVKLNDKPIEKISEFLGYLNVVLFSPEDLKLVKGSPANRRKFINIEVSQVNSYYHHLLKKYRHVLKQRNNLLKEIQYNKTDKNMDMLGIWDEQISTLGSKIIKKRVEVIKKIKILARLKQRKITDGKENLNICYENSLHNNGEGNPKSAGEKDYKLIFKEKLVNNKTKEIKRGYTTVGPHRDDLLLEINGKDVRKYGSQGQQRTVALSLKLAELEFMKSETGEYPVLLLDDVFSELDKERKTFLLNIIENKIQTFITGTEYKSLQAIVDTSSDVFKLYRVTKGKFK